jgi:hypothetical protein
MEFRNDLIISYKDFNSNKILADKNERKRKESINPKNTGKNEAWSKQQQ